MLDKEDTATIVRISGIVLSIASSIVLFIKPFEYVTNTLTVYFLLISAALLVMIGQVITIRLNREGELADHHKRQEAWYDLITIGLVMVLFIFFYVIPFIQKNTSWLS
jgi:hypothetical protein